jgi:16S rRNA (cytosine1402-N4)-methyltransferase
LLIGIDQDDMALEAAGAALESVAPSVTVKLLKGNFAHLDELLLQARVPGVDGILFDLGVSSPQLDVASRGFSYAHAAPLDMRMDPATQTLSAADIVNGYSEGDIARILRLYGEERFSARIAHAIIIQRNHASIKTTDELVDIIDKAIPHAARRTGGNPAKRTFQALRIEVNGELKALEDGLDAAIRWLLPKGRIAVITYHSLEDRIVKETFSAASRGCICPPDAPVCTCGIKPILTNISRKPLIPTSGEIDRNPRSRSAKLRGAQKASGLETDE